MNEKENLSNQQICAAGQHFAAKMICCDWFSPSLNRRRLTLIARRQKSNNEHKQFAIYFLFNALPFLLSSSLNVA